MSIIQQQVHTKFKVFEGSSVAEIGRTIRMFTAGGAIAAKSLGVEYVEANDNFLLCLGFAESQAGYPVKITEAVGGPLPVHGDTDELSASLEACAAAAEHVVCHDIYVDKENIVHIVFMEMVYI